MASQTRAPLGRNRNSRLGMSSRRTRFAFHRVTVGGHGQIGDDGTVHRHVPVGVPRYPASLEFAAGTCAEAPSVPVSGLCSLSRPLCQPFWPVRGLGLTVSPLASLEMVPFRATQMHNLVLGNRLCQSCLFCWLMDENSTFIRDHFRPGLVAHGREEGCTGTET